MAGLFRLTGRDLADRKPLAAPPGDPLSGEYTGLESVARHFLYEGEHLRAGHKHNGWNIPIAKGGRDGAAAAMAEVDAGISRIAFLRLGTDTHQLA